MIGSVFFFVVNVLLVGGSFYHTFVIFPDSELKYFFHIWNVLYSVFGQNIFVYQECEVSCLGASMGGLGCIFCFTREWMEFIQKCTHITGCII